MIHGGYYDPGRIFHAPEAHSSAYRKTWIFYFYLYTFSAYSAFYKFRAPFTPLFSETVRLENDTYPPFEKRYMSAFRYQSEYKFSDQASSYTAARSRIIIFYVSASDYCVSVDHVSNLILQDETVFFHNSCRCVIIVVTCGQNGTYPPAPCFF